VELLAVYQTDVTPRPLAFMSDTAEVSEFTGRSTYRVRFWTATGERTWPASSVTATITIKSDHVVNETRTVADFFAAYFADDVLFGDRRNLKDGVLNAHWPYQDKTVWTLVQDRQTFLQAADGREVKYAAEAALLPEYKSSTDKHDAALQAFIDDAAHPERQRLLALIAAARTTGGAALPLCKPSDVLLPGGGGAVGAGAGVYADLRDDAARADQHYKDLVDVRWKAVADTLT
jgi:hypothetical protein